jgi:hypothetical protein
METIDLALLSSVTGGLNNTRRDCAWTRNGLQFPDAKKDPDYQECKKFGRIHMLDKFGIEHQSSGR